MEKIVRITTIPLSLEKLLEGQLSFMNNHFEVIAVSAEKDRLEKYGHDNGVRTFPVDLTRAITPVQDLKSLFKLYQYLKKEKPLIVHTHTPKAGIIGMMAGKLAGVPIRLHTVAGLPLLETEGAKRKLLDLVEKLTYSLATRVYPNSFKLKEIVLDLGYAKESKLKVLGDGSSNGIDTEYFDPKRFKDEDRLKLKSELDIPEDHFVYIFVGRLVKEKGINELVKSFVQVNQEYSKTTLLLVGPFEQELDPLEDEVYELIKSHPKIITTGYQTDVRPYFAISDVLTFPSYREGFPNVVMQANAMNLPVIVSDINGCNEIVSHKENGLIIAVKDQVALYNAMKKLCLDANLRVKMTENARALIQSKYERKQFWKILLKEYKELEAQYKHD
ncbi:glycosyltransferase involved in cell wall biosynthesis [Christiangramia gaetbulicola]|uniref:Glycosyltransferase involved in cell wall biosynthesis n=1 Tax=Christiangramia gaetbulicola TaxID=703340 RepID=A0A2T6AFN6_9FLAO|nr:glycosyltransferase family 4 protein [Christiangramia gaetbulicola]PTX42633.1 glycosyltransferase involved in cell wall biosynthesis [Christiangramia gaetbulicola]